MAQRASEILGVPYVELDALHWTRPNWELPPIEEFRARVEAATTGDAWVVAGNYSGARDIVWSRADTVLWLDLPILQCTKRVLARTLRRGWRREVLWAGNRESLVRGLVGWGPLWLYNLRTFRRRQRTYGHAMKAPEYRHLHFVRLNSQRAIDGWLRNLARVSGITVEA